MWIGLCACATHWHHFTVPCCGCVCLQWGVFRGYVFARCHQRFPVETLSTFAVSLFPVSLLSIVLHPPPSPKHTHTHNLRTAPCSVPPLPAPSPHCRVPFVACPKTMRTATDVAGRLRWDPAIDSTQVKIGYLDRFLGVLEVRVSAGPDRSPRAGAARTPTPPHPHLHTPTHTHTARTHTHVTHIPPPSCTDAVL